MQKNQTQIIVITGPSASGKTRLAVKVAQKLNGYVLSADSRQVYKNLDISTGKVPENQGFVKKQRYWEIEGVKYYGFDLLEPNKVFTAGHFVEYSTNILRREKGIPIICGGTGLYIQALLGKTTLNTTPENTKLRRKLQYKSAQKLLERLKKEGFETDKLNNSEKHNKQRLIRRIEILKSYNKDVKEGLSLIGIIPQKQILVGLKVKQVEKKIQNWIESNFEGIEKEVTWLLKNYPQSPVFKGFIFKEFKDYIEGKSTKEKTKKLVFFEYKHYIKRQNTYMNKYFKNTNWFNSSEEAEKYILDCFDKK